MDYKSFVSNFNRVACVISVDLKQEDDNNRYFVVDANDAYKKTVVKDPADFETNVPYTRYIPKASNFEALCDKCVTSNVPVHTYFDIELYNAWMEVFLFPLASDDPDKGVLLFSYEMSPKADIDKLADISSETATNVVKTCLKLRETDDFKAAMNSVVEDIRVQCAARSCRILLTDFANRRYSLLAEAYVEEPGMKPMSVYMDAGFADVVETWPLLIDKSNCFIITNPKEMEEASKKSPIWVESLKRANVERLVIYPIRSNNETIGFIWTSNFDVDKTMMIKETLGLTSFILSSEIANQQNIKKMKLMSSTDLLTGVLNRNAMNNRISDDIGGINVIENPFGVIFVDVNGLKAVNDTKGHRAGDDLLKEAANTLKEFCDDNDEVYRVGGDEFLIIAVRSPLERFEKLHKTLIDNSERPGRVHFAVGACHSTETGDILKAMQKADARMYAVKEDYYLRHSKCELHS